MTIYLVSGVFAPDIRSAFQSEVDAKHEVVRLHDQGITATCEPLIVRPERQPTEYLTTTTGERIGVMA